MLPEVYSFRLRLILSKRVGIAELSDRLVLSGPPTEVVLRSANETALSTATDIILSGAGYPTSDVAQQAGESWKSALIVGFAQNNLGADLRLRKPEGVITDYGMKQIKDALEAESFQILRDYPGVQVFKTDPPARFPSVSTVAHQSKPGDRVARSIQQAFAQQAYVSPTQELAFDLYSATLADSTPDARFVGLMMAVEVLIEPQPRAPEVQALVASLIAQTVESGLPAGDVKSLTGSMRWLKQESISAAGRRLAASLGDRTYAEESPSKFFTTCYGIRSRLVHGTPPRPGWMEVNPRAAELERFVADLLSVPIIGPLPEI